MKVLASKINVLPSKNGSVTINQGTNKYGGTIDKYPVPHCVEQVPESRWHMSKSLAAN